MIPHWMCPLYAPMPFCTQVCIRELLTNSIHTANYGQPETVQHGSRTPVLVRYPYRSTVSIYCCMGMGRQGPSFHVQHFNTVHVPLVVMPIGQKKMCGPYLIGSSIQYRLVDTDIFRKIRYRLLCDSRKTDTWYQNQTFNRYHYLVSIQILTVIDILYRYRINLECLNLEFSGDGMLRNDHKNEKQIVEEHLA